jgi:hypothetical protein
MALYFLVLESGQFEEEIRPALAASWRKRQFGPCKSLCSKMLPSAREFAARYHLGDADPLLARVAPGLPFDRQLWQQLVGEIVWFSAVEIPELESNPEALGYLVAPEARWSQQTPRSELAPIIQAHRGSRDLVFGGGFYRPEHAGYSNTGEVARLAAYLQAIDTSAWQPEALAPLEGLPPEQRGDELAFLRDWFPALQALYGRAAARSQLIICEELD